MDAKPRQNADARFGGDRIFALLFGVAWLLLVVESLASPAPSRLAPVVGLVVLAAGTFGFAWAERAVGVRSVPPVAAAYFAVQLPLSAAVVYLSGGASGGVLFLLILAGQAVRVLRRPWMLVVWAAILLAHSVATPHATLEERLREQLGLIAAGALAVAFGRAAERERRARAELDGANRRLREYASRAEELATVEERNRLAREIHDGLGHYLTAINAQVKAARAVLEVGNDEDRAASALDKAEGLSKEALSDVRRSVGALRASPTERWPLPEALAELAGESRAAGLPTELVVAGVPRALLPRTEQGLYRAAQEGLTNARKHASGASRTDLQLDYREEGVVRLSVCDDGAGANADGPGGRDHSGGFGLLGLRERVGLLGGRVDVETAPGEGFALRVEVPG